MPTLRSPQIPHDYRRQHSSEKSPAGRAAACSTSKNNRASAKPQLPRRASRFRDPKTGALSQTQLFLDFLNRTAQRQPARSAQANLASASPPLPSQAVAPLAPGHAKNSVENLSSRSLPIAPLQPHEFLDFFSSLVFSRSFLLHFPNEYNREVAFLGTPSQRSH